MKSSEHKQLVVGLWTKFETAESKEYSKVELIAARDMVASAVPYENLVGQLVLMDSSSPSMRDFVELMEKACIDGPDQFGFFAHNVVCLLFQLSDEDLFRPLIREFIYSSARSLSSNCRLNATQLLVRMAMHDDSSVSMLFQLKRDVDSRVKKNAEVFFKRISDNNYA
jgi:hypothetical protein